MSFLMHLFAGFSSLRKPMVELRALHVGFVVGKTVLRQILLRELRVRHPNYLATHTQRTYHRQFVV